MHSITLASVAVAPLSISPASAQQPALVGATANPQEYFKLGEAVWCLRIYAYYRVTAQDLKPRLDSHRALMEKLKFSKESLAAFDSLAAASLALPFPKETDFSKWSAADKQKWHKDHGSAVDRLHDTMCNEAALPKNSPENLYYWLGWDSMRLSWTVPADLRANGNKVSAIKETLAASARGFERVRDHRSVESLTPEVLAAVKAIASMKPRMEDPLEEISSAEVDKMVELSREIRDAAKEKRLVAAKP